ncbi:MAG: serine hydrolase domain-containing protein [Vicinamibacterales bacterium]
MFRGLVGVAAVVAVLAANTGEEKTVTQVAPVSPKPEVRFDPAVVHEAASALPRLRSLIVSRGGELLFERYYNGAAANRVTNIKSASKSVISTLVGIAIERKLIAGVETPIATWFPQLAGMEPEGRRRITVANLLEMRSGLEGTSGRDYGPWVLSRNWVQHALARPMFAEPDAVMEYSTGNTHLLSAILTKATGMSTLQFANEVLGKPLGFTLAPWPRDPQGIYFGGNDMLMTPRQLLAYGELYLDAGRAGDAQVVPEAWVARSCEGRRREFRPGERRGQRPRIDPDGIPDPPDPMRDRQYGYGWWVHEINGFETCFAWGYGGQYVFVLPELDMVVVTTASPDVSEERRGHRRQMFDILAEIVPTT